MDASGDEERGNIAGLPPGENARRSDRRAHQPRASGHRARRREREPVGQSRAVVRGRLSALPPELPCPEADRYGQRGGAGRDTAPYRHPRSDDHVLLPANQAWFAFRGRVHAFIDTYTADWNAALARIRGSVAEVSSYAQGLYQHWASSIET